MLSNPKLKHIHVTSNTAPQKNICSLTNIMESLHPTTSAIQDLVGKDGRTEVMKHLEISTEDFKYHS